MARVQASLARGSVCRVCGGPLPLEGHGALSRQCCGPECDRVLAVGQRKLARYEARIAELRRQVDQLRRQYGSA